MGFARKRLLAWGAAFVAVALTWTSAFASSPALVVDADSGSVLYQDNATAPWFPASTTKLMTTYVALSAVREGRITMETPLMVSPRAAVMPPSKMGFRPGTLVTLDNALKMLMVKSPNDVAVTIAEGVSGSVENFANEMNLYATRLGLHESHFANPNGLPDANHVSSARDMAIIGRALLHDFPQERGLFGIGLLAFGGRLIHNHNGLLGLYPGIDGMKTGFTCAAGYNIVVSAERDGRHLIVVVMGAPSGRERDTRVVALLDRFLSTSSGTIGNLDGLPRAATDAAPDNRPVVCSRARGAAVAEAEAEDAQIAGGLQGTALLATRMAFEPVRVFVGPVDGWSGRIAQARDNGAKELTPAPIRQAAFAAPASLNARDRSAAVEAPAPGPSPLALVGATELAPAAVATGHLVHAAPGVGLSVRGRKHTARGKRIAPVTAMLAKPRILATREPEASPAPRKPARPAVRAAQKAAPKPAPHKPAAGKAKPATAKP